jgi:hypothetical protein
MPKMRAAAALQAPALCAMSARRYAMPRAATPAAMMAARLIQGALPPTFFFDYFRLLIDFRFDDASYAIFISLITPLLIALRCH